MGWYAFDVLDYRTDTHHLSTLEHGAYRLLLDEYYLTRLPLPDNDKALAKIAGLSLEEWHAIAPTIREFFRLRNGRLHQSKCDRVLDREDALAKKRSSRAKNAAEKRHAKSKASLLRAKRKDANAVLNHATRPDQTRDKIEDTPDGVSLPPSPLAAAVTLDPCLQVFEFWNRAVVGHSRMKPCPTLTTERRQQIIRAIKDLGSVEAVTAMIARATESSFLTGRTPPTPGHENWKCRIEFVLKPKQSQKIMEGDYDDTHESADTQKPIPAIGGRGGPALDGFLAATAKSYARAKMG